VIETPPRDRLPVHTEIVEFDPKLVTDADPARRSDSGGPGVLRPHRVETIHNTALRAALVPQVKCEVAHGQMAEKDLERVMLEFLDKKSDVLVSTMIIESGLDIPSVNTLILDRADMLGLAQLYQLRGRVGRSANRAYAYLMVPSRRVLTEEAEKRLRVIEEIRRAGRGLQGGAQGSRDPRRRQPARPRAARLHRRARFRSLREAARGSGRRDQGRGGGG
jgi:transcription-repair coupling factor (superfamily II helicase)